MQNLDTETLLASLPGYLAERCESIGADTPASDGQWIVYWMHHAMRAHENPALEVAIAAARHLDKPLIVYQGLGGRHKYDSDRSHMFILQGARDVARELREKGIDYQFWLPEPGSRSPLPKLCANAAVVVTEHMPVAPFTRWQTQLAATVETAILRVDARCIVPMTFLDRAPDRAFRFRDKTKHEYRQRISEGWPGVLNTVDMPRCEHQLFTRLAIETLSDEQLSELIADQPIDHTIGPIVDTPGGSVAGYQRWQTFLDQGLASYHRKRNDAALQWPEGVSRMSPYLHYGMVSPFRVAQQADSANRGGSGKFIEELTIWRELAHHFCAHCADADSLKALPKWAQDTLAEHQLDQRAFEYPLTSLQRGTTHSELWNLAQRSLLVHGELHNNLRMTWAKAIAEWRATPTQALEALLDLNHRYALDGNDPSSYGGLLWALGLFDRPFDPPQPVLGTVRPRSVDAHAKRMDIDRYRNHIDRSQGPRRRIAIIGAGIAGLTAAQTLHDQNHDVTVFEKSRGPGGRTATRRRDAFRFDHGAQYFTAGDPRFIHQTDLWLQAGVIEAFDGPIVSLSSETSVSDKSRWRGVGGMNRICQYLAEGVLLKRGCKITKLEKTSDGWALTNESGDLADRDRLFDTVLVTAPAPQTAALLSTTHSAFGNLASAIEYDPCWALMAISASDAMPDWGGAFVAGDTLDWISVREAGDNQAVWVAHASPQWTREHLESNADTVAEVLGDAINSAVGTTRFSEPPIAHRWRYARVRNPSDQEAMFDHSARLGIAGDWLGGSARIESAWLSGAALAGHVLRAQSTKQ
ncbi:MAG: FAD-dependent oxidoreductase [Pseudomonadota bacterium]